MQTSAHITVYMKIKGAVELMTWNLEHSFLLDTSLLGTGMGYCAFFKSPARFVFVLNLFVF